MEIYLLGPSFVLIQLLKSSATLFIFLYVQFGDLVIEYIYTTN